MDATIFLPNKSQCPIVIFCHGFNGYKDDFREIAEHLLVHEIGSVMITFCGSGARDKSGYATTNMTLFTEREDLFTAMDYAKSLPQFNEKLFLFGGSQGGMICALAAQARPDDIYAMALLFPALCIPDNWNSRFPQNDDIPDEIELWKVRLGRQFVERCAGWISMQTWGILNRPYSSCTAPMMKWFPFPTANARQRSFRMPN